MLTQVFFWLKRPLYSLFFQSASFFPSQEEYKSTRHQYHVFTKAWSLNYIFSWIPSKLMCIHGLEAVFLLPETIATAHIKCCTVLLAWSLSYVSIHQILVCNTRKIKPSPSELREHIAGKDAPVLLLSICWSYSPHLALTRQVVLNIFLAQMCLCVGNFSSHTYFYITPRSLEPSLLLPKTWGCTWQSSEAYLAHQLVTQLQFLSKGPFSPFVLLVPNTMLLSYVNTVGLSSCLGMEAICNFMHLSEFSLCQNQKHKSMWRPIFYFVCLGLLLLFWFGFGFLAQLLGGKICSKNWGVSKHLN